MAASEALYDWLEEMAVSTMGPDPAEIEATVHAIESMNRMLIVRANAEPGMAVAPDGWKARQIANDQEVALTVPVRRGGILSLLVPIPPATITFRATATVHPAGSLDVTSVSKDLAKLVPDERKDSSVIIELVPKGRFLTYGIGVSLMEMRDPRLARASVPVFS